jgi:lipoyl(octanoyl) transferase
MQSWRWLDSGTSDGRTQMSIDLSLLRNPCRHPFPTVRVYQWKPFCISLGYHQSATSLNFERCREKAVDVVRRPTGGRAVFHSEEVTYAVIVPRESDWFSRPKQELYRLVSIGISKGLMQLGLPVEFVKRSIGLKSPVNSAASVSCFSSAARWEITLQGRKLVGSAQRLLPTGILQHGSILLGPGYRELFRFFNESKTRSGQPGIPSRDNAVSIQEYNGRKMSYVEVTDSIKKGMEETLPIRFSDSELRGEEILLAESVRDQFAVFNSGSKG